MMAELLIDLIKLRYNIQKVHKLCTEKGLEIIGVVKGCFAHLPIVRTFQETGIKTLGIARTADAVSILPHLDNRPMMITLPLPREAKIITRYFKASLNSEVRTIQALSQASDQNGIDHEVILMVDNGDLREGVMPEDVLKTVRKVLDIRSKHLRWQSGESMAAQTLNRTRLEKFFLGGLSDDWDVRTVELQTPFSSNSILGKCSGKTHFTHR